MEKLQQRIGKGSIKAFKIHSETDIKIAKMIRHEVFVIGQHVPEDEEIDNFEDSSYHFLAYFGDSPCGAARWRFAENGIKLERFAVLEKFRGMGVGSALVDVVLGDISNHPETPGKMIYLHAQLSAIRLYSKFGFKKVGKIFQECEIDHYKMIK